LVEARFGWSVTAVHASGGREMNGDVPAALAEIGRSVGEGPVVDSLRGVGGAESGAHAFFERAAPA
jgi:hypothetical protein